MLFSGLYVGLVHSLGWCLFWAAERSEPVRSRVLPSSTAGTSRHVNVVARHKGHPPRCLPSGACCISGTGSATSPPRGIPRLPRSLSTNEAPCRRRVRPTYPYTPPAPTAARQFVDVVHRMPAAQGASATDRHRGNDVKGDVIPVRVTAETELSPDQKRHRWKKAAPQYFPPTRGQLWWAKHDWSSNSSMPATVTMSEPGRRVDQGRMRLRWRTPQRSRQRRHGRQCSDVAPRREILLRRRVRAVRPEVRVAPAGEIGPHGGWNTPFRSRQGRRDDSLELAVGAFP